MHRILFYSMFILFSCGEKSTANESKTTVSNIDSTGNKDSVQLTAEITCPKCGFKKNEQMPTEVCLIKYTCTKCKTDLFPKEGDCCVFCTYSPVKCPSMQEE